MTVADIRIATFAPVISSVRAVRVFVGDSVSDWGLDSLRTDSSLCASELAANAVLHSRKPFTVVVLPMGDGIRIEAIDSRPDLLPYLIPTTGSAADLTAAGGMGRGLLVIATVAARWGASTAADSKDVWAEITPQATDAISPPVLRLGHHQPERRDLAEVTLLDLPVRSAVASGLQVAEITREARLNPAFLSSLNERGSDLFDLVDRGAPVYLAAWHAALRAAAADAQRFDLQLCTVTDAWSAMASLRAMLRSFAGRSSHRTAALPPGVDAFRYWLEVEAGRQRQGESPSHCSLDT
jgi:anti-sigma regulatory factor (Ser/Thr protein kinase)